MQVFDAGRHFSMLMLNYEDSDEVGWQVVVSNPDGVQMEDAARYGLTLTRTIFEYFTRKTRYAAGSRTRFMSFHLFLRA